MVVPTFYLLAVVTTESVLPYEDVRAFVTSTRLQPTLYQTRQSRLGQLAHDLGARAKLDVSALVVSATQAVSGFFVAQAPAAAANVSRFLIPTVSLFFGILGGRQAHGFLGMFLGPAVVAILVTFARTYREQYAGGPPAPPPAST